MRGARTFFVAPKQPAPGAGRILYLHGGGYVQHMIPPQWYLVRRLVETTGRTVVVPHYKRAPAFGAAEILDQVLGIYADLVHAGGAERLALLGDSSGGGMALAVAQMLRDAGKPLPEKLVMLAPWLDLRANDPEQAEIARGDPMLDQPGAQVAGRWYARDIPLDDPRVSPLNGDLRGLPPMLLLVGTRDMLVADARRLKQKAAAQGVPLAYREYPEMFHVWAVTPIPEAQAAFEDIAAFLRN